MAETASTRPADRELAVDFLNRFLGQQRSTAEGTLAELTDDEIAAIAAAGTGRRAHEHDAVRRQIKDVLTGAYDRRRDAAAKEALARERTSRRSALARQVLEDKGGVTPEDSTAIVGKLEPEELDAVGRCTHREELQALLAKIEVSRQPAVAEAATDAPSED